MLKNFKIFFGILLFIIFSPLKGEEKIDIWKNKQVDQPSQNQSIESAENKNKPITKN